MSPTRIYDYPVWYTQGGGLVREVSGTFIFIEKPDCPGLDVGDEMPAEWDLIPANEAAQEQGVDPYDQMLFDEGVNELFETLFEKVERGEITIAQLERFFPADIEERNTPPNPDLNNNV